MTNLRNAIDEHYKKQQADAEKIREATKDTTERTQQEGFLGLSEGVQRAMEQNRREADYKRSNRNA
ncbi:hypothetical protein [Rhodococcus cercidiphylli]|uniref:Uncharacterized protein n=1 Tax=Rhodococcus cercidiphylli TaxID=489916 RepID=A0ABU4B0C2_9NOCA|nr:hypothetical protein [Rhodococcus cercidiphylli]MDV6231933.1 hypothetical protein [Rhodococcus cercidiphylli]